VTNMLRRIREGTGTFILPLIAVVLGVTWIATQRYGRPDEPSVLIEAALKGDEARVALSLASGTPINCVESGSGMTPLMYAAASGRIGAAKLLLAGGADLVARTRGCGTPLAHAARSGGAAMVRLLIQHGADPNVCNRDGYSPLMHAVAYADIATVDALITGGADVDVVDQFNNSALTIATDRGDPDIVRRIESAIRKDSASDKRIKLKSKRRETFDLLAVL
jgi:ankyrin repeat protein